jgi:hypothetical protein
MLLAKHHRVQIEPVPLQILEIDIRWLVNFSQRVVNFKMPHLGIVNPPIHSFFEMPRSWLRKVCGNNKNWSFSLLRPPQCRFHTGKRYH